MVAIATDCASTNHSPNFIVGQKRPNKIIMASLASLDESPYSTLPSISDLLKPAARVNSPHSFENYRHRLSQLDIDIDRYNIIDSFVSSGEASITDYHLEFCTTFFGFFVPSPPSTVLSIA